MIHLGDIKKISGYIVPPVEVIIGGSPCQDLSVAGKRSGLQGKRSGLFMEQIRIIKEMRENDKQNGRTDVNIRPRYMVWENVPGAFTSTKGEDFHAVLEETARIFDENAAIPQPPKGKWRNAGCIMGDGWSIAWRVLDAQFWGVPQRRRRIALVADFGGDTAPEILFERESLSGNPETCGTSWEETARYAQNCIGITNRGNVSGNISETLRAESHGALPMVATHSKAYGICSYTSNSMLSHNPYSGIYEANVAKTLDANCGNPACNQGGIVIVSPSVYDARGNGDGKTVPTITGDHNNRITDYTAICVTYNDYNVRRLTPLECERLQGFPDGWTDIGAWEDSRGKIHKESTDSARYRALGNSIALPPWRFVLSRINVYLVDHTMASLFDGIGGFPLIWNELNGSGRCLWASEIEEFPIAVTKKRLLNK